MTDTMLDIGLDEWLNAPAEEPDWEPDGQADANRLLGVLRHIERQLAEDAATAGQVIEDARSWQAGRAAVLERRRERLTRMLEGWARMRHAWSGGREVTWKLPAGELKLRPTQPKCEVDARRRDGEDAVARVLAELGWGDLVKIEHSVRKGDAKKLAERGDVLADYPAPPGYEAHQAVVSAGEVDGKEAFVELPGVVILAPVEERSFSVKAAPVSPPELAR